MIRVAVIGAGHWGPNLINNFRQSRRSEVAWVVDRDPARLAAVAERFPDLRTTRELGEALADASPMQRGRSLPAYVRGLQLEASGKYDEAAALLRSVAHSPIQRSRAR